jgi:uncharacterized membrane protein YgaE (UPF0421/DUF939 family)
MRLQEWFVAFALRPAHLIPGRYSTCQAVARVLEAEETIFARLQALVDTPNADAKRQAIENELASLRVLKRDKIHTPQSQVS